MQTRYAVVKEGEEAQRALSYLKTEKLALSLLKTLGPEYFIKKQELMPSDYPHSSWIPNEEYGRKYLKDFEIVTYQHPKFTIEDFNHNWKDIKKRQAGPGFVILFGSQAQYEEWLKEFDEAMNEFAKSY